MKDYFRTQRWRLWGLVPFVLVEAVLLLVLVLFPHSRVVRPGLNGLCGQLFWPEGGMRDRIIQGGHGRFNFSEDEIGKGDLAFARSLITPEAWTAAPGLKDAERWPGVVFQASWAGLFPRGYGARVIRAKAGNRMGLWIFGVTGRNRDTRGDVYLGHPGGNSGTPFETYFLDWADEIVAINVLHRPDRRLENFVFQLNEKKPVCRVISDL